MLRLLHAQRQTQGSTMRLPVETVLGTVSETRPARLTEFRVDLHQNRQWR